LTEFSLAETPKREHAQTKPFDLRDGFILTPLFKIEISKILPLSFLPKPTAVAREKRHFQDETAIDVSYSSRAEAAFAIL
jgi:hypothetical protein